MESALRHRFGPRRSLAPAAVVLLLGVLFHAIEQATLARPGPVPVLLTAPLVGTMAFVRFRAENTGRRRVLALLTWGFIATGVAVLLVVVVSLDTQLPRPLTGPETVAYDLALFLWLVLSLGVVYARAARYRGRRVVVALLAAPVAQGVFALVPVVLVEAGRLA